MTWHLSSTSLQDTGPIVGNCYNAQYTQGSVLFIRSNIIHTDRLGAPAELGCPGCTH